MFSFFRCTLFTYFNFWQEIMADADVLDFKRLLSYHHWRFAWYSFLDLLDISYEEGFCCAICGKDNSLDTVISEDKFLFMLMFFLKNALCIIYPIILVPSMIQGDLI